MGMNNSHFFSYDMYTSKDRLNWRSEVIFLFLAGIFLSSMTLLNILSTSKMIDTGFAIGEFNMVLPIGVLAYPVTFLCTDFISEIFGKKRANLLVWIGLVVNLWVLLILFLGEKLPDFNPDTNDYSTFYEVSNLTFGAVIGSMLAYFVAQFVDVKIFHFFKEKHGEGKLWIRNNTSTMISQLIDSVVVILVVHFLSDGFKLQGADSEKVVYTLTGIIIATYVFKFFVALVDTIPFYFGVKFLRGWLSEPETKG